MSEGTRGPDPAGQAPPSGAPRTERTREEESRTSRTTSSQRGETPERPPTGTNGSSAPRGTTTSGRSVPWDKVPTGRKNSQPAPSAKPAPSSRPAAEATSTPGAEQLRSGLTVAPRPGGPEFTAPDRPVEASPAGPVEAQSSGTADVNKPSLWDRLGFAKKDEPQQGAEARPEAASALPRPSSTADQVKQDGKATQASSDPVTTPSQVSSDTVVIPTVSAAAVGAAVAGEAPVAAPSEQVVTSPKHKVGAARRTRKARLRLSRLDPWSVMKTSFLFSIAAGIMLVVAVYVVWTVIGASSLFDSINDIVKSVVSTPGDTTPFRIQEYINTQKVMGVAALLACVDVVIFTALATLGSFLYNLAATMLGGLEITLAED